MPKGKIYRIEVGQGPSGLWYHRLVHIGNGQVVYSAETFASKYNAARAADTFYINNGGNDSVYIIMTRARVKKHKLPDGTTIKI